MGWDDTMVALHCHVLACSPSSCFQAAFRWANQDGERPRMRDSFRHPDNLAQRIETEILGLCGASYRHLVLFSFFSDGINKGAKCEATYDVIFAKSKYR